MLQGDQTKMDASINKIEDLQEWLHQNYFKNGRTSFAAAFEMICLTIESLVDIMEKHPKTLVNLLKQVKMGFTQKDYEDLVLKPIQAARQQDPMYGHVEESLRTLRKFLGFDQEFLTKTFHREISMLKVPTKKAFVFTEVVKSASRLALERTIKDLDHQQKSIKQKKISCAPK